MADTPIGNVATDTATSSDYVVGVKDGTFRRFGASPSFAQLTGASTATPTSSDTVVGVQGGVVKRFNQDELGPLVPINRYGADSDAFSSLAAVGGGYIPDAAYTLASQVSAGSQTPTFTTAQGATFSDITKLMMPVVRPRRVLGWTFGTYDNATAFSVIANPASDRQAQVLGFASASAVSSYADRDSVALYVDNQAPALLATCAAANYTTTTLVPATPLSATEVAKLRVGMLIDTAHATKYTGTITGWASDGTSVTVSGWFAQGDTSAGQDPADATTAYINPITKAWAQNSNVFLSASSHASKATGFELGVLNNKGALDFANTTNYIWGFDAVSLGTYEGAIGFIARNSTSRFYRGFESRGAVQYAYSVNDSGANNPAYGYACEASTGIPFMHNPGGTGVKFKVAADGAIFVGDSATENGWQIDRSTNATGGVATITAQGVDAVINATFSGKGSTQIVGIAALTGLGNEALRVTAVASQVNQARVTGAATGNAPSVLAGGADANIDLKIGGTGTGTLDLIVPGVAATSAPAFSATHKLTVKVNGSTYYMPVSNTSW